MLILGFCENGEGVPQSHAEAAKLYKKACDGGYAGDVNCDSVIL